MELENLKKAWTLQKTVSYSTEELNSIYHIKQMHSFRSLRSWFSWDLQLALLITIVFIGILQMLDLRTSNFWSLCLAVFATQHVLFYLLQLRLLRKYSTFKQDISASLNKAIGKIKVLLWFYRLWPAALTIILTLVYTVEFNPRQPIWLMLIIGSILAGAVALLSNVISAVIVRKQLVKLDGLAIALKTLND